MTPAPNLLNMEYLKSHLLTLQGILNSYLSQLEDMGNWCAIALRIIQRERAERTRHESPNKLGNIIKL